MEESFIDKALRSSLDRSKLYRTLAHYINHIPRETRGDFIESLEAGRDSRGLAIIVEYKRCSPSSGFIAYRDVESYIGITSRLADAYSVLTEPYWFCGSMELVRSFSRVLPVIVKDFIASEEQVAMASIAGGSAILIIDHPNVDVHALTRAAWKLGLDVLIETTTAYRAVKLARKFRGAAIGINSRDLHTLKIDFSKMLSEIHKARRELGRETLLVAESGVKTGADAVAAMKSGADAILVGTEAMRRPELLTDIYSALKEE